ncbi:MAG: hypothetical protein U0326_36455 [Polyangiales bacterium]
MEELLDRLVQWFARERPELTLPPSPAASAPDLLPRLPDALHAWFARIDPLARRAPAGVEGCVLRDWRLLDRATSEARRAAWNEMLATRVEFDGWWRAEWVPILERIDGDFVVVDLEGTFDAPGSVVEVVHDAPIRYVRTTSLGRWLGALVDSLEAGEWVREEDGLWWDDPDAPVWQTLGAGDAALEPSVYPRTVELGLERAAVMASPTTARDWVETWRNHLVDAAPEALWGSLPHGWCALRWRCGADLDETLARLADAPPRRRATELARLANALHAAGDARAAEVAAQTVSSPPTALARAALILDLSTPTLRDRFVERAVASAVACVEGAGLLCAAVAAAVVPHDAHAARHLRWWSARLRPTPETRFAATVVQALAAARAGEPDAGARVRGALTGLGTQYLTADEDFLVRAAIHAAHAVGLPNDPVLTAMTFRTSNTLVAVRALVEVGDRASARTLAAAEGDATWSAALGVCFANALPEGDAEGGRALTGAVALGSSLDDIVAVFDIGDAALLAEVRRDRVLLDLRAGDHARVRARLDRWWQASREHVASLAARHRDGLADAIATADASYSRAPRADLDAAAAAWRPSQTRERVTRRLLLGAGGLADGDDAAAGRAMLERVASALRADRTYPGRFADVLALSLARHGRVEEALAIARDPWWVSSSGVFVALIARLVRLGLVDDALSLGRHLTRGRELAHTLEVAPAVCLVAPDARPVVRAAIDALCAP